jgi:hypothetical protein
MPATPTRFAWRCALAALAALLLAASPALAAEARYEGASADGGTVFFSTTDQLVTGDTDNRSDVFERSKDAAAGGEYVTRIISVGPTGGNQAHDASYAGASADGTRVFFTTKESMVPTDTDQFVDIYMRDLDGAGANTTTLVSRGDASCSGSECGNGAIEAIFVSGGIAAGGEKVFFRTVEDLSPQDEDAAIDIYMRNVDAGTTTPISRGAASCAGSGCGNGSVEVSFKGTSTDGTTVFFTSKEELVAGENDGLTDIYARDVAGGTTTLVSSTGTCPEGLDCSAVYGGAAADGSHVFFETNDRISGADTDSRQDVYDWSGGTPALASTEPDGGNDTSNATYAGNSADGGAVFFHTDERMDLAADGDEVRDVYRRAAGVTTLISTGPSDDGPLAATFKWASPDGSSDAVVFVTSEALTGDDGDSSQDVYVRDGTTTTRLSQGDPSCAATECGDGSVDAEFVRASADGSHVFFVTDESLVKDEEPLVKGDSDTSADVYRRLAGATTLISTGPLNGNGPYGADLHGVSQDGARAFFVTKERLTAEDDFAGEQDVYSRSTAGTLLVSVENDPDLQLGPAPPTLGGTSPASPGASTEPRILGQADAGTQIKIYTTSDCSGEQAVGPAGSAGGTSAELASPGIAVTVAAFSTTSFYATAEAEGIVSECSGPVTYTQSEESPPPPPPPPPGEGGSGGGSSSGGSGSGGTPAKTHSGGVPYVTPETQITYGPAFKTRVRRPVFRFTDATGQPGTSFLCRVDRQRWRGCGSPLKLKRLAFGKHVFKVKAVNAVGDWEPAPVKRSFKVVGR